MENVIKELGRTFPLDGLLPVYINPHTGATSSSIYTFGAMGDRYLLSGVYVMDFMKYGLWTTFKVYTVVLLYVVSLLKRLNISCQAKYVIFMQVIS